MPEKTTRTYSLPNEVAHFIDSLPKRERSKFVSSHLSRAVKFQSKQRLLSALDAIVPVNDGDERNSVDLVKEARERRLEQVMDNTKPNG